MNDCCSSDQNTNIVNSKSRVCPESNIKCLSVPFNTVLQHVKKPWINTVAEQAYFFCSDEDCDVVYFGEDNNVIRQSEIRTPVGVKQSTNDEALICYCFDISNAEARRDKTLKQFVMEQTKNKHCSCETKNPSGRCCLKDFKKLGY